MNQVSHLLPLFVLVTTTFTTYTNVVAFVLPPPVLVPVGRMNHVNVNVNNNHNHNHIVSFVPTTARTNSKTRRIIRSSTMFSKKDDDDETKLETNKEITNVEPTTTNDVQPPEKKVEITTSTSKDDNDNDNATSKSNSTKRDVSFQAFKLFSYIIQFLGLYFSFGLLLNILGYGYSFDLESGFRVDKVENLRNERQFEMEMMRMSSSKSSLSSSPSGAAEVSEEVSSESLTAPTSEISSTNLQKALDENISPTTSNSLSE